jgi:glycosyltransferase involved in cell wall biosynthesis
VSEPSLRLAVAVPTRNRRDRVLGALDSVAPQLREGDELLVVDNGSADGTPEAVQAWLDDNFPPGRVLVEPEGGVSVARNRALHEAGAGVVCFLDDDIRADEGWLDGLRRAWTTAGSSVAGIGGPIRPEWEAARPAWLTDHLLYVISVFDLGGDRKRLDQRPGGGFLWGGNMSFRKEAVQAVGEFDPHRGARPVAPSDRGEEEELQRRLDAAGWEVWYEPAVPVRHLIPAERITRAHFYEIFRRRALGEAERGVPRRAGFPRIARGAAAYVLARLRRRPSSTAALFAVAHGWTLLTARRSRTPSRARPPSRRGPRRHRREREARRAGA